MDTLTLTTIVGIFVILAILLYAYIQTKNEIRKEREMYGEKDEGKEILPNRTVTLPVKPRDSYDEYRNESNDIFPAITAFAVMDSLSRDSPASIEPESNSFSGFGNGGEFGGGGSSGSWDSSSTDTSSSFD